MANRRGVQVFGLANGMQRMTWIPFDVRFGQLWLATRLWGFQASSYAMLNLLDDPAWLALIFC